MTRPKPTWRSLLFVPVTSERFVSKAHTRRADAVILDLEDSVAPEAKAVARDQIAQAIAAGGFGKREILIRVNTLDSPWWIDDVAMAGKARPARGEEIPLAVAVPAFMVSELTTAFRMGLFLYLPLLLVDLLVAAVLMSLGMAMVPPTLVSLPLKIGIFLLADGWHLIVSSLVRSFA